MKLCRLRYTGSASTWGFAIYRASHNDYEDNVLPNGSPQAAPRTLSTAMVTSVLSSVRNGS
jgi:hypothetical protein